MDFVNKLTGGGDANKNEGQNQNQNTQQESGGFMDKLNGMAGGGAKGEQNEDALDKGIDYVQEHVLGQGQQNNETAAEQAKDEAISDYLRGQYKSTTGSDIPIEDKDKKYGL
jgi:hypothetical protein